MNHVLYMLPDLLAHQPSLFVEGIESTGYGVDGLILLTDDHLHCGSEVNISRYYPYDIL